MTHKTIVAMDIGYSNLKMVWRDGEGQVRQQVTASGAAPLDDMPGHATNKPDLCGGALVRLPSGIDWVGGVSHRTPQQTARVLDERYPTTDAYLANFLTGLARTGLTNVDRLVTGLPVSSFYNNNNNVERLKQRLAGHHFIGSDQAVTVHEVIVLPQPVGACFSTASEYPDLSKMDKRVLVLDPGFFSFDFVVVDGIAVRHKSSGTSKKAISTVLGNAAAEIQKVHGAKVSREALEQLSQRGDTKLLVAGKEIDAGAYIASAVAGIGAQVANEVMDRVRQESDEFDAIILAGGGAAMFEHTMRSAFGQVHMYLPRHPVLANAKGYFLYGTQVGESRAARAS